MTLDTAPHLVTTASGRRVGYRRIGSGPPVALLHASPRSSAVLVPLAERLAGEFTVFAFDTPGFGWSEPLSLPRPDAADFGVALIEAFDALGLDRVPVYGSHTGAAIAVAAALSFPQRVVGLVLDGYAVFTPTEQAEYLASYLKPIRQDWEGASLAWIWSRVKDQFSFFPWYLRGQAARLPRPLAPLALMQGVVVDFLAAGDDYRAGYASAFRFEGVEPLRRLTVPTLAMARTDDLLFGQLDKLTDMPDGVRILRLGDDHGPWADAIAAGFRTVAHGPAPAIPPAGDGPGLAAIRVPGGVIGLTRFAGPGDRRPLLLLPPIPGSAAGSEALARRLAWSRPVLAADLPGFGTSTLPDAATPAAIAEAIGAALARSDIGPVDIAAQGESASIGICLAARMGTARLALLDPPPDEGCDDILSHMPDVTPRGDGAHLLAAWHRLRDGCLWRPWFARTPDHAIPFGTDPDVPHLHAVLTDWMRGGVEGEATLRAALSVPLAEMPAAVRDRTSLVLLPDHPWSRQIAATLALPTREATDDRHRRADAVLASLA